MSADTAAASASADSSGSGDLISGSTLSGASASTGPTSAAEDPGPGQAASAVGTDTAVAWIDAQAGPGRVLFRVSALAEVAATCALITGWALLGAGIAAWMAAGSGAAGTEVFGSGPGAALWFFVGAAIAAPVRLVLRVLAARFAAAGRDRVSAAIRARLVPDLLAVSGATSASDAADALIDDAPVVASYLAGSRPLRIAAAPSTLLILAAVAVVHWPVAVLLALCTALLPLNLRLAGQATLTAGERQLAASRRLSAVVTESARGLPTLVSLRALERRRDVLGRASTRLEKSTLRVLTFAFLSGAVMDVAVTFAIAVSATYTGLVLLGFLTLPGAPALGLGGALFVLLLCPAYFAPAQRAARGFHDRDDALVATRAILTASAGPEREAGRGPGRTADRGRGPTAEQGAGRTAGGEPEREAGREPGSTGGGTETVAEGTAATGTNPLTSPAPADHPRGPHLEIDHLGVGVGTSPILTDITMTLPAGEWTAISGPSGSGKTTLLQVIAGRRVPTTGTIRRSGGLAGPGGPGAASGPGASGESIAHGWLGSDTVILGTTLAENISLGDESITAADVRAAAHTAGLDEVLASLPDGIDTALGTLGRQLSAGERRRVAIARLAAADRSLWILDEPTAHLDQATEAAILDTLRAASTGRTVVIATHSPAVIAVADHTHELRAGSLTSGAAADRSGGDT
ncbi:ATP-binding cassette domain-containing protein [Brevibacterium sp. 2SA]|uniref:ATP-binding cassette domain-containing protein n=1 Tax=Brevibacterium sp. 2SA TaxID=2502198 RepID=UPI0014852503|nr:ATP-binding cassette domain-containing protein [Brevibacterium sp. 2SA]